jgi:hypothetical protein
MTGRPLRFTANGDSLNAPGTTQTPIQIAPFRVMGGIASRGSTASWFDTSAFCPVSTKQPVGSPCPTVANGVMGNMGHYVFAGPHFFNLDASVVRRFPIKERVGLEFRAEAFNASNTPQFDLPNVDMTNANFGRITGTAGGNRAISLGAKITF